MELGASEGACGVSVLHGQFCPRGSHGRKVTGKCGMEPYLFLGEVFVLERSHFQRGG